MEFIMQPWHWFVLGIILILSELILPAFAALWFGIAAIIVALLFALFPSMSFVMQCMLWIIIAISCTLIWFKYIKPLSKDKTKAGLAREATLGQIGMVIQTHLDHEQILVRFPMPLLGSDEWMCRCLATVAIGDRVIVTDILGNDLVVKPYSSQAPH
ncbi:NfeD family protein [Acinetobacter larvae]|uniref:Uncharacterized protein n=1 Tax=Acinetobacter larvae TaxID=1789224 RepID=A0A1B2M460_9GAMM|nr:NfeD family protein [Acinetobacter larvae]AOA59995.1 hypothetical protein BFG52_12410 [Acinetobacter larvae]